MLVYNGLASSNRSSIVRLPVSKNATYRVTRLPKNPSDESSSVVVEIASSPVLFKQSVCHTVECKGSSHVLLFDTGPLPPIGASIFQISMNDASHEESLAEKRMLHSRQTRSPFSRVFSKEVKSSHQMLASNGFLTAKFDR